MSVMPLVPAMPLGTRLRRRWEGGVSMPYKDRAQQLAYFRSYTATHKADRARERHFWDSAKHANERAARYGRPGILKTADVRFVFAREGFQCFYCHKPASHWFGLDHRLPLALGGDNVIENVVLSCHQCNVRKHRKPEPTSWTRGFAACIACNETSRPHSGRGLCGRCYQREKKGHDGTIDRALGLGT